MKSKILGAACLLVMSCLPSAVLLAGEIPLENWTVPAYTRMGATGGLTAMADVTFATAFVGMSPCRIVDTRQAGFPAGYGPPSLAQGVPRNFDLRLNPNCTGIPSGVEAYSLNITVTNTLGPGFILIYPQGGPQPTVSTVNYVAGQTIANAAIVPAGNSGGVTVVAGVSGTDLIIDINGYFTNQLNTGNQFYIQTSIDGDAAIFVRNNSNAADSHGIVAQGSITGANSYGVEGQVSTFAVAAGLAGVHGIAMNTGPNITYGGKFESANTADCSAGLLARAGSSSLTCGVNLGPIGVLATNTLGPGVLGLSTGAAARGVQGCRTDGTGNFQACGALGYTGSSGVHSFNDVTAAGTKPFIQPHPRDPSKQIKYVALEGNEVGTYFRGRARFERGIATIDVPEDFRMVTEPEGLSIQVTPIGEMASYAVVRIDLDRIVVKGSRNVEFFYTVNGVRQNYAGFQPIEDNVYFIPQSAADDMGEWPEMHRQLLVQNGTLKPEGTVNAETARRLGWDRRWEGK